MESAVSGGEVPVVEDDIDDVLSGVDAVDIEVFLPNGEVVLIRQMSLGDPVTSIKQVLSDFKESGYYSNFSFFNAEFGILNEFVELRNYYSEESAAASEGCISLSVIAKDYDTKSARAHVKRVKEVIAVPSTISGAAEVAEEKVADPKDIETNDKLKKMLDRANELHIELEAIQKQQSADAAVAPEDPEKAEEKGEVSASAQTSASGNSKKSNKKKVPRETVVLEELEKIREEISRLRYDAVKVKKMFPILSNSAAAQLPPPVDLSAFYNELLFRLGSADKSLFDGGKLPSACIKTVSLSGWNPPPPYRQTQGDLMYIEVVTETEGIIQITSTAKGFFVNRSTRQIFDPKPSEIPYFSHELLELLIMASPSFKASWQAKTGKSASSSESSGALDSLATLYAQGAGDASVAAPQWNVPPSSVFAANLGRAHKHHNYDLGRVQDDLIVSSGGDEQGATREWNDEIQALRGLPKGSIEEKILKAKYTHRVVFEFGEACKSVAVSISEKLITPINYNDDESIHIYLYNGIFVSRAVDTDDRFKVLTGLDAHRKSAMHDLKNQKEIMQFDIDGISSVLHTIVDYKGDRFICQTLIPGILSAGENNARLMYGTLEKNKRLTVKKSSLELMRKIGACFHIPERRILADPPTVASSASDSSDSETAASSSSTSSVNNNNINGMETALPIDAENPSPVTIDLEDEVDAVSQYVPFVGCLEGKLLRGTDGRTYVLEVARLTCRDANYVSGPTGTGKIDSASLDGLVEGIAPVYIIRSELIKRFIDWKIKSTRDKIISEAYAAHKKVGEQPQISAEDEEAITKEIRGRCKDLSPETLGFSVNPNVFFECANDADAAVVQADEAQAREIAVYLWDVLIPLVTEQVRVSEFAPYDNEYMVTTLHALGINLRYLGRLARCAFDQELKDIENVSQGKQRIQSMPYFWLELLEIEMIARSFKHLIDSLFRDVPAIHSCPGDTIASALNAIFGSVETKKKEDGKDSKATTKNGKSQSSSIASGGAANSGSGKNKKKGGKGKGKGGDRREEIDGSSAVPEAVNAASDRSEVLSSLRAIMKSRFIYDSLLTKTHLKNGLVAEEEKKEGEKAAAPEAEDFLNIRINKMALLRRICKHYGLRVATRNYDFNSDLPFSADDIVAFVPRTKTCEAPVVFPDAISRIFESRALLDSGKFQESFELAQVASNWIHQICGPMHKDALESVDHITNILCYISDYASAINTSLKSLNVAAQLYGMDSQEVLQSLMQVSTLYIEMRDYENAMKYILASKYLLELLGGDRHPDISNIYCSLALIAKDVASYDYAIKCYNEARLRSQSNLTKYLQISEDLAEVLMLNDEIDEAFQEQRVVYTLLSNIVDEESAMAKESKAKMEKYFRLVTIRNVNAAKEKLQDDALKREKDLETARIKAESIKAGSKSKAGFRKR